MGKKIIGVIAFAAIAVAAGWNYQQNKQNVELSDLALANIKALASGEESGKGKCYNSITTQPGSKILYCSTCTYIETLPIHGSQVQGSVINILTQNIGGTNKKYL